MKKVVNLLIVEDLDKHPKGIKKDPKIIKAISDGRYKIIDVDLVLRENLRVYLERINGKICYIIDNSVSDRKTKLNHKTISKYAVDENDLIDSKIYEINKAKVKQKQRINS